MKTLLPLLAYTLLGSNAYTQIITPQVKANFGVDAELRGNFVTTVAASGNDDWFLNSGTGAGKFVIDTTGSAIVLNNYITDVASRNLPLIRNMSFPPFSIVNNKTLIDAVFVRDYHGDDSTIFASGSNKNGMTPDDWSTPVAQSVPDKNEILDIYMHVRRDGKLATDSLWMFGAVSIENTTGNRYFDFEMFQTDIFYDRPNLRFVGFGPDAGHTSWEFDEAGNIIKAGDIILTAEYGSSALSMIEARIWVHRSALTITPQSFRWSGLFDGAGSSSQFGYASIIPKEEGAFYTGLQNSVNSWGGSFAIIRGDNSMTTDYTARQFMEFSVNLTKLGLDPVTILGGSTCDMPFQKVMVKTRASTSFTAALKDFVAPFKPLNAPKAQLFTNVPIFCGVNGISNLKVLNPVATSVYTWETLDGNFSDTTNKTSVFVDQPGTYIVHHRLGVTCPVFSSDTITIDFSLTCGILLNAELAFTATPQGNTVQLNWNALRGQGVETYQLERSEDGIHYQLLGGRAAGNENRFMITDPLRQFTGHTAFYRLLIKYANGQEKYSASLRVSLQQAGIRKAVSLAPNPVRDVMQIQVQAADRQTARFLIIDATGTPVMSFSKELDKGSGTLLISGLEHRAPGVYTLKAFMNNEVITQRFLLK
jgi:hypothetical protein